MQEITTASQSIGITTEQKTLRGAVLRLAKGKAVVEELFIEENLTDADHVKPLYIQEKLQVKDALLVSGLSSQEVLVRPLEIKLTKERDIEAVIQFQTEPLLPYPLDRALIDRFYISTSDNATWLSILAARKDHVQLHLDQWKDWQVEPEIISCIAVALAAFAKWSHPEEKNVYAVHIGDRETTCAIVSEGKLLAAHAFPLGLQNLITALSKDRQCSFEEAQLEIQNIDFAALTEDASAALYLLWQQVKRGTLKAYYALSKYSRGVEVNRALVTGLGATVGNLSEALCQAINKPLLELSGKAENHSVAKLQEYAAPIGLALTGLEGTQEQINFRRQELAYPDPWKRYKKPAMAYIGMCLATSLAIVLFGNAWVGYQEDKIKEEYGRLLQVMNKSFSSVESDYVRKFPGTVSESGPDAVVLRNFSLQDLGSRLEFLEKELQSAPDTFPLQPNVPRVSDVLAWLSTHVNVAAKPENDSWQPLLFIENFSYTLVKRPELSKKHEKYQVKLELEFSAPTPKSAREFHDALIASNDFVDSKSEIKWSANRGKYRTSFYLKDKTSYPALSSGG